MNEALRVDTMHVSLAPAPQLASATSDEVAAVAATAMGAAAAAFKACKKCY